MGTRQLKVSDEDAATLEQACRDRQTYALDLARQVRRIGVDTPAVQAAIDRAEHEAERCRKLASRFG